MGTKLTAAQEEQVRQAYADYEKKVNAERQRCASKVSSYRDNLDLTLKCIRNGVRL